MEGARQREQASSSREVSYWYLGYEKERIYDKRQNHRSDIQYYG